MCSNQNGWTVNSEHNNLDECLNEQHRKVCLLAKEAIYDKVLETDVTGDLSQIVWSGCSCEPVVRVRKTSIANSCSQTTRYRAVLKIPVNSLNTCGELTKALDPRYGN